MAYIHTLRFEDNGPVESEFIAGESSASVCSGDPPNCAPSDLIQMEAFALPGPAVPSSISQQASPMAPNPTSTPPSPAECRSERSSDLLVGRQHLSSSLSFCR